MFSFPSKCCKIRIFKRQNVQVRTEWRHYSSIFFLAEVICQRKWRRTSSNVLLHLMTRHRFALNTTFDPKPFRKIKNVEAGGFSGLMKRYSSTLYLCISRFNSPSSITFYDYYTQRLKNQVFNFLWNNLVFTLIWILLNWQKSKIEEGSPPMKHFLPSNILF